MEISYPYSEYFGHKMLEFFIPEAWYVGTKAPILGEHNNKESSLISFPIFDNNNKDKTFKE